MAKTHRRNTMHVTDAQLIHRYSSPEYLIQPIGDASDPDDIDAINASQIDVLDGALGWSPYTAVIRVTDDTGVEYDYLATLANVEQQ